MVFSLIFLLGSFAWSQTPFYGANSAAMGGSGRASIFPSETALNPAMITQVRGYNLSFDYRNFIQNDTSRKSDIRASMVDNNTNNITPAAFTFGQSEDSQEFRLGFGKTILNRLAIGIEAQRYVFEPQGGHQKIENDVGIGFLYAINPDWAVALLGSNLIRTNLEHLDQSFALASTYAFEKVLRLQVDLLYSNQNNPLEKVVFMGGIESGIIKDVAIRFGYRADNPIKTYFWTAGLGWNGPKLDLNYGFESNIKSSKEKAHSIDLRIYF